MPFVLKQKQTNHPTKQKQQQEQQRKHQEKQYKRILIWGAEYLTMVRREVSMFKCRKSNYFSHLSLTQTQTFGFL